MKKIFASLLLVLIGSCYGIDQRAQRRLIRDIKKGDLSEQELEGYIQDMGIETCLNSEIFKHTFHHTTMLVLLMNIGEKYGYDCQPSLLEACRLDFQQYRDIWIGKLEIHESWTGLLEECRRLFKDNDFYVCWAGDHQAYIVTDWNEVRIVEI